MKVAVEVTVKSVASVETVGATASTSMTPCEAWRGRDEKERNRQEECRNYWSHAANSAERVNPHATRVSTAIAIHPGAVASVIRGGCGFPSTYFGRCGELHKRSGWCLVGRDILRSGLARWAEMFQAGIDRLDVAVAHSTKVVPRAAYGRCRSG